MIYTVQYMLCNLTRKKWHLPIPKERQLIVFLLLFEIFNQNPRLPTASGMEAVNIATNKVFETLKIKTFTYFLIEVFYNLAAFESNCL